ncbi:EEF1A lysine methyltransferase 1 [Arctopsyche grandis]|uniref:EEF1A lysine methyltransferase 1 n=1 Tax=Arctopsyche grandis TaxID=121162 RepID=UPI00406D8217
MSDDEDMPQLPADTIAFLQEFYALQKEKEELLLKLENGERCENEISFDEDWQLSQFWYDDPTIENIVKVVTECIPPNGSVCLISSPTLYSPLKKALGYKNCTVKLFEYDKRFKAYGDDFIYYDFNDAQNISEELHKHFDIVIADPPFLSEECLTKTSASIKILAKDKIILCTGTIMCQLACELLGLKMNKFKPKHKNNLANEFSSYSNFDFDNVLDKV